VIITNYTELQQAVADWLNRSDLDTVIPAFIDNAEARLNRRVRHREMQSSGAVTIDANGEADLPADYVEWKLLVLDTTPKARPEYVEPDSREFLYRFRPYSVPQYFTILQSKIKVQPATATTGTLYYYAKLPALADNATNWLLDRSPETYLYAALVEGASYLRDEQSMSTYAEQLSGALTELVEDSRASRLGRTPAEPVPLATHTQEQKGQ